MSYGGDYSEEAYSTEEYGTEDAGYGGGYGGGADGADAGDYRPTPVAAAPVAGTKTTTYAPAGAYPQRLIGLQAGAATFDSIFSLTILVLAAILLSILHDNWTEGTTGDGTLEGGFYQSPCNEGVYRRMSIGLIVVSAVLLLLTVVVGILAFACARSKKGPVMLMTIVSIACWITILGLGAKLLKNVVNDGDDTRCTNGGHYDAATNHVQTGYLYLFAKATAAVAVACASMMIIYQIFHFIAAAAGGRQRA